MDNQHRVIIVILSDFIKTCKNIPPAYISESQMAPHIPLTPSEKLNQLYSPCNKTPHIKIATQSLLISSNGGCAGQSMLMWTYDCRLQADSSEHAECCLYYINKCCSWKHFLYTSLLYLIVLAAIHNRLPQLLRGTTTILHAVVKVYLLLRYEHITKIRIT